MILQQLNRLFRSNSNILHGAGTTTERDVALTYAKSGNPLAPSTVIESCMGMVDRGASLDWLSQYPHEREILWPPLTALEVLEVHDEQSQDSDDPYLVRRVVVRLSCNLVSDTLEKLLSVRKRQTQELMTIVTKDIVKMDGAADVRSRQWQLDQLAAAVEAEQADRFTDNVYLTGKFGEILSLLPKLGDEMQVMQAHTRCVCGLSLVGDGSGGFASSAWDGTALLWQTNEHFEYRNTRAMAFADASMTADSIDGCLISGQVDGTILVRNVLEASAGNGITEQALASGRSDAVVAVAALPQQTAGVSSQPAATLLASGDAAGRVMLWNLSGEAERPFILEPAAASSSHTAPAEHGHSNTISAVLWIRDSDGAAHLVTASFDCRILVCSLTELQQGGAASISWALRPEHSFCDRLCAECSASDHAHRGAVTALAMVQLDDAACVVSGCEDSSIKVWSLFGQLIRTVRTHTSGQHQSTGTKNDVLCCMSLFSW